MQEDGDDWSPKGERHQFIGDKIPNALRWFAKDSS